VLSRCRFQFGKMKSSGDGCGVSCTTVIPSIPSHILNDTLENGSPIRNLASATIYKEILCRFCITFW
jgi:hypothetical protein